MSVESSPSPPAFHDSRDPGRLRGILLEHDFTPSGIESLIGPRDLGGLETRDYPVLLRLTRGERPLATLLRLFHMGIPVTEPAARAAIEPMTLDEWVAAGLVSVHGGEVNGAVRLVPHGNGWFASDHPRTAAAGLPADFVIGVGGATRALAGVTIRRRIGRALDMGTGCGVFAVLAADHCDRVVAVDRNPRAVGFARFNAALNGKANVECIEGDLFEPVADQRFDLVVCNPPFVISPKARYTYRDGGLAGDGFVQRLVREAPSVLADGGFCQIMCQWAHIADEPWEERLRGWFEGSGCDVWVLRTSTQDPTSYAMGWIATTERVDARTLHEKFDEWLDYYEAERIQCMSDGFITMRKTAPSVRTDRPGEANWFRCDSVPPPAEPLDEEIVASFDRFDFLEARPDPEALAAARLTLSPLARLEQRCVRNERGWASEAMAIGRDGALATRGSVNAPLADLLAQCDGSRPIGELIADLATRMGHEPAAIMPETMSLVRMFVGNGILLPAGDVDGGEETR